MAAMQVASSLRTCYATVGVGFHLLPLRSVFSVYGLRFRQRAPGITRSGRVELVFARVVESQAEAAGRAAVDELGPDGQASAGHARAAFGGAGGQLRVEQDWQAQQAHKEEQKEGSESGSEEGGWA
eukprot:2594941-Rhodomonas_salina.1